MVHRLRHDAGRTAGRQAGGEQRQHFPSGIHINKRAFPALESFGRAVIVGHGLGEDGVMGDQLIVESILREILRAILAAAGGMTFPIVEQDVVLVIRPPDGRVFEFAAIGQEVVAIGECGVRSGLAVGGIGNAAVHLGFVLEAAEDIDAAIGADERGGIAGADDGFVRARPRAGDGIGHGIAGLVG